MKVNFEPLPPEVSKHLPLTPLKYAILGFTLFSEKHGYQIMTEVNNFFEETQHLPISVSNFYPALKRCWGQGLLEATASQSAKQTLVYKASDLGRAVYAADRQRMQRYLTAFE